MDANPLYTFKGLDIGFGDEFVTFLLRYTHKLTGKEAHTGFQLEEKFFRAMESGYPGSDLESQTQLVAETVEKQVKNGPQKARSN